MGTAVADKEKKNGGYMTIEATVIVFLTSILVMGSLLLLIYYFDLGCAKSFMDRRILELAMEKEVDKEKETGALKKELQNLLMISDIEEISLDENVLWISGELRLRMRITVPVISDWIGDDWGNRIIIKVEKGLNLERMRRWDAHE